MRASWLSLCTLSTVNRKSASNVDWQYRGNEGVLNNAWTTSVVNEVAQVPRVLVNQSPKKMVHCTCLLCKTTGPKHWSPKMTTHIMMENWCWCQYHGDVELSSSQTWVLWEFTKPSRVYSAFCEKPLAKHHPHMMVEKSDGLETLDVVWVKESFTKNSADKGNTNNFSSCNSSHTGFGTYFHSSQYANFSVTPPYLSRHLSTHLSTRTP